MISNRYRYLNDDGKLARKFTNKCVNAKKEGLRCLLTIDEYCELMERAKIKSSDLGYTGNNYVLARYNDTGDYTKDNCSFITQKQNAQDKIISDEQRLAMSRRMTLYNELHKKDPIRIQRLIEGIHRSEYFKRRKIESELRKKKQNELKHKSYCGARNSQYGTFWITDGLNNKKWKPIYGDIPQGYIRGRVV